MATTSTAPIKQEDGAPGSPSPMQPSALEPGTISRKRPEPQCAMVPFAGSSTDAPRPAKKAKTITKHLEAPRARVALATDSCVTLSVVLPQSQKLVELELKFVDNCAGVAMPNWRPTIKSVKLPLSEHNDESILVKLPGLKLSKSCAGFPSNPAFHMPDGR